MNENQNKDEALKKMFQLMFESMMEGERTAFLGYGKHNAAGYGTKNSRNGYYERDLWYRQVHCVNLSSDCG